VDGLPQPVHGTDTPGSRHYSEAPAVPGDRCLSTILLCVNRISAVHSISRLSI